MESSQNGYSTMNDSKNSYMNRLQNWRAIRLLVIGFLAITFILGCSKEELGIDKVPFDEIDSNYYFLNDHTIEVPTDIIGNLVLSKNGDDVVLRNDPIFDNLTEGTVLISDPEVSRANALLRKVVSFERNGDEIHLVTAPSTLIEAYERYYINSEFDRTIKPREDFDISSIFGIGDQLLDTVFNGLYQSGLLPLKIDPTFSLTGKPEIETLHPHDAYIHFSTKCKGNINCNIDKKDSNNNHIWDEVENYFGGVQEIEKTGLYTITFKEFGIDKLSGEINFSDLANPPDASTPSDQLFDQIKSSTGKSKSTPSPDGSLNFKYFPAFSFWGVVNVTIPIGPEFSALTTDAALFALLEVLFQNRIDLRLGHVYWKETVPSLAFDIQAFSTDFNGNESSVPLSSIVDDPNVILTIGAKGSLEYKFGVGVGAALTIGEAQYAGISAGGLISMGLYSTLSGEVGMKFTDLLNTNGGGSSTVAGNLCLDMGMDFDFSVFVDDNAPVDLLDDWFDTKIAIPKAITPVDKVSFMQILPNYQSGSGICYGFSPCDGIELDRFDVGFESGALNLEFKFNATPAIANETYVLELERPGKTSTVGEGYQFGKEYEFQITDEIAFWAEAIYEGTLKVKVTINPLMCNKDFGIGDVGVFVDCNLPTAIDPDGDLPKRWINPAGKLLHYFTYEDAELVCEKLGLSLAHKGVIQADFVDANCHNPTGFILPVNGEDLIVSSNESYIWLPSEDGNKKILKIEYEFKDSQRKFKSFTETEASESVYAPCICYQE